MENTIKLDTIKIEVSVYDKDIKCYGKQGLKELLEDIIDRYFHSEYFDPNLVEEILEERENRSCRKCGKTSGLLDDEDICYTCANKRGLV